MKYSNELLESRLLDKFMPKASFFAVCDWLYKTMPTFILDIGRNKECICVQGLFDFKIYGTIHFDEFGEVCFYDLSELCLYKPNFDNQFDSANQYD